MKYTTTYEVQTHTVARQLASMLSGGEVITLSGDLGAGKTAFTKGLADGLGVTETVTSPTFAIMQVYPAHSKAHITQLVHIDTYRLDQEEDLRAIGVTDYLGQPDTVVVIEWPEHIPTLLSAYDCISVTITKGENQTERTISIDGIS